MGPCESNHSDLTGKNLLDRRAIGDPMGPKPEAGGVTRSGGTGSDIVAEYVKVREGDDTQGCTARSTPYVD
jgi:hypothetical protein